MLGSGLGDKHPKILVAEQQSTRLKSLLLDEVRTAMTSEPAKKPKKSKIDERILAIEYVEAKKAYEMQKGLLNKLQEKLASQTVESVMPTILFIIHEKATVPALPTKRELPAEFDTHLAVGGTAFDMPGMLVPTAIDGYDERKDGVGFRFVMADE